MDVYVPTGGMTTAGSAAIQAAPNVQYWITADGQALTYLATTEGGMTVTGTADLP